MKSTRRSFLMASCASVASSLSARAHLTRSANEVVRVGIIGTGVRGKCLIGNLPEEFRVTVLCDCAESRIVETMQPREGFAAVL